MSWGGVFSVSARKAVSAASVGKNDTQPLVAYRAAQVLSGTRADCGASRCGPIWRYVAGDAVQY
jgi:hypothetical protein